MNRIPTISLCRSKAQWGQNVFEIEIDNDYIVLITLSERIFKNVMKMYNENARQHHAQPYLQPHYGNGVFGNVYILAGQHYRVDTGQKF